MKKNNTTKSTSRKADTARASAVAVYDFINGKAPDFLSGIVQTTVDDACDHVGFARLMHEPGFEKDDLHVLTNLCRRTQMLDMTELEKSKAALARHIIAIYRHPLTPVRLWNAIAQFVTDGTNLKISACEVKSDSMVNTDEDVNLVEEWNWTPSTIERIVDVCNTYDAKEVDHDAN